MSLKTKLDGMRLIMQFDNRWQLVAWRLFFPHEPINIYRLGGVQFLSDCSAGDANGAREVIATSMYKKFVREMKLTSPLKVFDIGANNGGFPLLMKTMGYELEKTVCVEMNPNTFSRLRFNVESNVRDNCVLYNAAVCGVSRELELNLGTGGTNDTIYQEGEPRKASRAHTIRGMTFDDIYASAFRDDVVDVCKIDIEGAEYEIFASPNCKSIARCRYVIIEIHDGEGRQPGQVVRALQASGFVALPVSDGATEAVYGFRNTALEA
jgi:FkbM family methyltransferase